MARQCHLVVADVVLGQKRPFFRELARREAFGVAHNIVCRIAAVVLFARLLKVCAKRGKVGEEFKRLHLVGALVVQFACATVVFRHQLVALRHTRHCDGKEEENGQEGREQMLMRSTGGSV